MGTRRSRLLRCRAIGLFIADYVMSGAGFQTVPFFPKAAGSVKLVFPILHQTLLAAVSRHVPRYRPNSANQPDLAPDSGVAAGLPPPRCRYKRIRLECAYHLQCLRLHGAAGNGARRENAQ